MELLQIGRQLAHGHAADHRQLARAPNSICQHPPNHLTGTDLTGSLPTFFDYISNHPAAAPCPLKSIDNCAILYVPGGLAEAPDIVHFLAQRKRQFEVDHRRSERNICNPRAIRTARRREATAEWPAGGRMHLGVGQNVAPVRVAGNTVGCCFEGIVHATNRALPNLQPATIGVNGLERIGVIAFVPSSDLRGKKTP